mgnify:FL=1
MEQGWNFYVFYVEILHSGVGHVRKIFICAGFSIINS